MRTPYAHRAFGVTCNAYSSDINKLKKKYYSEDDSEAILRHWRTALRTPPRAVKSQPRIGVELIPTSSKGYLE